MDVVLIHRSTLLDWDRASTVMHVVDACTSVQKGGGRVEMVLVRGSNINAQEAHGHLVAAVPYLLIILVIIRITVVIVIYLSNIFLDPDSQ